MIWIKPGGLNGVIAGAVETYLKDTGFWEAPEPAEGVDDISPFAATRLTLSERVRALEKAVETLKVGLSK